MKEDAVLELNIIFPDAKMKSVSMTKLDWECLIQNQMRFIADKLISSSTYNGSAKEQYNYSVRQSLEDNFAFAKISANHIRELKRGCPGIQNNFHWPHEEF